MSARAFPPHLRCLAPLLLLVQSVVPSCAVVAGAGVGYVLYQEVLENDVHIAMVQDDVDRVWASVQETMGFLIDPKTELVVHAFPRRVEAKVDGTDVAVEVQAYDIDRTEIRVEAEKFLARDGATAAEVMGEILDRLD